MKLRIHRMHLQTNPDNIIWRVVYSCNNSCSVASDASSKRPPALTTTDLLAEQIFTFAQERFRANQTESSDFSMTQSQPGSSDLSLRPQEVVDLSIGTTDDRPSSRLEVDREESDSSEKGRASKKKHGGLEHVLCEAKLIVSLVITSVMIDRSLLQVQSTVAQAIQGRCSITLKSKDNHPDCADRTSLRVSPYLRRLLHYASSMYGMTRSHMAACMYIVFEIISADH